MVLLSISSVAVATLTGRREDPSISSGFVVSITFFTVIASTGINVVCSISSGALDSISSVSTPAIGSFAFFSTGLWEGPSMLTAATVVSTLGAIVVSSLPPVVFTVLWTSVNNVEVSLEIEVVSSFLVILSIMLVVVSSSPVAVKTVVASGTAIILSCISVISDPSNSASSSLFLIPSSECGISTGLETELSFILWIVVSTVLTGTLVVSSFTAVASASLFMVSALTYVVSANETVVSI